MKKMVLSLFSIGTLFATNYEAICDSQFRFNDPAIVEETMQLMIQATQSKKSVEESTKEFMALYKDTALQEKVVKALKSRFNEKDLKEIEKLVTSDTFIKYSSELYRFARDVTPAISQAMMSVFQEPAPVAAETRVIEATDETLDELLQSNKNVVLDIYSTYCGPCKTLAPILDALSLEKGEYVFVKINSDMYPKVAQKLKVRGVPTLLFYQNGKQVGKQVGFINKDSLGELLVSHFN